MCNDIDENTSMDQVRAPNVFERVKEEIEALVETIHRKKEAPISERRFLCTNYATMNLQLVYIYIFNISLIFYPTCN